MISRVKSRRILIFAAGVSLVAMTALAATLAGYGRLIDRAAPPGSSTVPSPADQGSPRRTVLGIAKTRAAGTVSQRFVRAGTAIDVELVPGVARAGPASTLRVGDDVTIRFRISDAATGQPITAQARRLAGRAPKVSRATPAR